MLNHKMEEYTETSLLLKPGEVKETSKYAFLRTIAPFMVLQASIGLCASLQATFYPIEAEVKGATASQFGAVFGIIHLALFIFGQLKLLTSLSNSLLLSQVRSWGSICPCSV